MKTLKMKLTGIRPLLMHNGMLADREYPFTKEIKDITKKKAKMTDADHQRRDRLEWEGGIYWDSEDGPVIPSDNIERMVQLGAQKSRVGKDVQAAVFCTEPHFRLEYDGPRDKEKLYASPRFVSRKGCAVNNSRIMRIRPMFPTGWNVTVELEFDETIVNESAVIKATQDAGALVGLGDWRPKFGRFTVEVEE